MYERNAAGDWLEVDKLVASDATPLDNFGWSVAISGDTIVIDAFRGYFEGDSGTAYVYERNAAGNWLEVDKLVAPGGTVDDDFGRAVAIAGDWIVVGANNDDGIGASAGAAFVYQRNAAGDWLEIDKLVAPDITSGDQFGYSVAMSSDRIVVGAFYGSRGGAPDSGSAYVFERNGSSAWVETDELGAADGATSDFLGASVAISGDLVVAGARGDDDSGLNSGSAYAFQLSPPNDPPTVDAGPDAAAAAEGATVTLAGSVTDPDDATPTIAWSATSGTGVDAGATCTFTDASSPTSSVSCTDDGTWTLTLTADDGTNPPVSDSLILSVTNAAPMADAGPDQFVTIGDTVSLAPATFTDAGSNDTHTATIDWGDGTVEPGVVTQGAGSGSVAGSHTYATTGLFTATVTVTDDDGGADDDTIAVLVDPPIPLGKLIASDGEATDYFGASAAVSGDRVVVGAFREDDNGLDAGAAYVYERNAAGGWDEVAKLLADEGAAGDYFGLSVAIDGDRIVVGAYEDDVNGTASGAVYVFERNGVGGWTQVAKLLASDGATNDAFGLSVAVSGDRILVGGQSSSAYVFERDASGDWLEDDKLVASDAAGQDYFGQAVAIAGDRIVVGAWADDVSGTDSGSAYVFDRVGAGDWVEVEKLAPTDGAESDAFGISVAIEADRIVVGAYHDGDGLGTGSAYVFEPAGAGNWTEAAKLVAADAAVYDYLGYSVAITGDRIAVGAFGDDGTGSDTGSTYIYARDASGDWAQDDKLVAADAAVGDQFGYSVAISGNRLVVGALNDNNIRGTDAGAAYVFDLAPLITPPVVAAGPDRFVTIGDAVSLAPATFTDAGTNDTHTATIDWGDGTVEPGVVTQGAGSGSVAGSHTYATTGLFTATVTVTDDDGGVDDDTIAVLVDPPIPPNKLLASDGAASEKSGLSVAISGDRLVVGAESSGANGELSGSANVYERNSAGDWIEVERLVASDGSAVDLFGSSVAMDGDLIVVGAYADRPSGLSLAGSAYVFERNASGDWVQLDKLVALDGATDKYFGISVAITGDRIVIGAYGDNDNGQRAGAAYVFERNGPSDWQQTHKILASDGAPFDGFGEAVAISGDRLVVTAVSDDGTAPYSGSAYVFERNGLGDWIQADKLLASDGVEGHRFGQSVGISGSRVVVGATGDAEQGVAAGAAYVFERDGSGDWAQVDKLLASDGATATWTYQGIAVSISGSRIAVGALYANGNKPSSGAVYMFRRDVTGDWVETDKLIAADGAAYDFFGRAVAISGDRVAVGASSDDNIRGSEAGAAYVFELAPLNAVPTVAAGADATAAEGATITLAGSVTDPDDPTPTILWTATPGAGVDAGATCAFVTPASPTSSVSCTDDGTWTLTLTADDGTNPPVSDSLTLSVTNAVPVVNAGTDRFITIGDTITLVPATFTDAGPNDTHTATIDWGDGTVEPGVVTQGAGSGSVTFPAHTYAISGLFTATVIVTDDDGGQKSDVVKVSARGLPLTIVFHGSSTKAVTNGGSLSLTRPATALTGDVLIASIDVRGTTTISPPAGWTPIRTTTRTTSMIKATYWHLVGASDPAAYVWNFSPNANVAAVLLAYGGVDGTTPIDIDASQVNGVSLSVTAPSVTTVAPGTMLIGLFAASGTPAVTPPAGMTERAKVAQTAGAGNKITSEAADELRPTAGATGPRIATITPNGFSIGHLIALRPGYPPTPDEDPPTVPQDVVATAPIGSQVSLSWSASTDNVGVDHYVIQRAVVTSGTPGPFADIGQSTTTDYLDDEVVGQTTYRYVVVALDILANASDPSASADVTTPIEIVFHGSSTKAVTNGGSLSLTRPATALTGDVLIASIDVRGTTTISPPAGWTPIRTTTRTTSMIKATYWHLVGASDPAAYVWNFSPNANVAAVLLAYGGVDGTTPIDIDASQVNGVSLSVTAPSVTTVAPGTMLIGLFAASGTPAVTPPAGMTERAKVAQTAGAGNKITSEAADELRPTAGATGPRIATITPNGFSIGHLIALRPSP